MNDSITTLAFGKMVKEGALKKARETVKAGVYIIDGVFRLRGTITVGEDYKQAVSQSIPWQRIAYILFSLLARQIGPKAVMKALKSFDDGETPEEFASDLNAAGQMFLGAMSHKATKTVKGKVTTDLRLTEVKLAEEEEVATVAA